MKTFIKLLVLPATAVGYLCTYLEFGYKAGRRKAAKHIKNVFAQ